jgi:hypothetical protein
MPESPPIGLSLYDLVGRRMLYALLDLSVITIGMIVLIGALVTLRMRRAGVGVVRLIR